MITYPVPQDLDRYYQSDYHGGRHGFTAGLCDRRRLGILRSLRPSGTRRLLDIGCGDGTFLKGAQKEGWHIAGVEKYPQTARNQGIDVYDALDKIGSDQRYDCITLWHVLEHLPDLNSTVAALQSMLAPDGVLVIAVPDAGSFQAQVFGAGWLHLDVPRHLYHFTEPSLIRLLNNHSMEAHRLHCSEFEYDWMGWVQSILNRWNRTPNLFFKLVTGRRLQTTLPIRTANYFGGATLSALGLLPVWLSSWTVHGGTLIVVARNGSEPRDRKQPDV